MRFVDKKNMKIKVFIKYINTVLHCMHIVLEINNTAGLQHIVKENSLFLSAEKEGVNVYQED